MSNKYKQLNQKTAKLAMKGLCVVALFFALYVGIDFFAGDVEKQKAEAERKTSGEADLLRNLRSQMDKSGEAEKRFAAIQEFRTSTDYSINKEVLQAWLRSAVSRYHFNEPKMTLGTEGASDKSDLANFNYNISIRPQVKLEFKAASDLHIFSFLEELRSASPGLIRVNSLQVSRRGDIDDAVISQINNGITPILIEAKMELGWIGLSQKKEKGTEDASGAPAAPMGAKGP